MLKNYIIEKELGKGTYGIVYKATKKDDNKICVIKQISLQGLNQDQKKEVKLESEILKSINSKYVVKYYDSFEEENNLNIVMEYCESGDLNDFIENQKKTKHLLQENIIWKFFIKITLGLADIHKSKILHRDLKSLNIFLKEGNDIRVGDLGVAKVLNQTFFAKTFIGTPYYLSPEICEDKPYNDKSDVWALGCILYELCTYRHPFTAKSQGGLILKILNDNPEPINDYYSKDLKHVLNKIFDKDFKNRPSCLDILKMKNVIDKAKNLGIFEDIKSSFPDIEKHNSKKSKKVSISKAAIKHIVINDNKGNKNSNNNAKKRPQSGVGLLGKKGKYDLKFNKIGAGGKKKTPNLGGVNIPIKNKKGIVSSKIKIVPSKEHNNNKNKGQKKDEISQKEKDINFIFKEAEKFEKRCNINKNNNNNLKEINNNNPTIFNNHENQNNLINTKDLNKAYKVDSTLMTKNIDIAKENNNKDINDNINKDIQKETIKNPSLNYSIDTVYNKENPDIKNTDINNINLEQTKDKNDNNNCTVESDIYMTAKREYYQPHNANKEEKSQNKENPNEKIIINNNNNNPKGEDSLPLMQTNEFNELISDFASQKDATVNAGFKIIDNVDNKKEGNADDNKSVDSGEEKDDKNKYLSDNEDDGEENTRVTKVGDDSENEEENKAVKKENLTNDLKEIKAKIDILKNNILKLIGEEKYKQAKDLMSSGIEDDSKQEEINEKVEQFIKGNCTDNNEEKMYDILSLFILECQYKKKQEQLNKLN